MAPAGFYDNGLHEPVRRGLTIGVDAGARGEPGHIRLRSADPTWHPEIEPGYFDDGADLDAMIAGYRTVHDVVGQGPMARLHRRAVGSRLEQPDRRRHRGDASPGSAQTLYHPVAHLRDGHDRGQRRRPRPARPRRRGPAGRRRLRHARASLAATPTPPPSWSAKKPPTSSRSHDDRHRSTAITGAPRPARRSSRSTPPTATSSASTRSAPGRRSTPRSQRARAEAPTGGGARLRGARRAASCSGSSVITRRMAQLGGGGAPRDRQAAPVTPSSRSCSPSTTSTGRPSTPRRCSAATRSSRVC